jgi:hypothetical protein
MRTRHAVLLTVVATLAPIVRASAQASPATAEARRAAATKLASGTWTGTIAGPNGNANPVEFEVTSAKDSATIVILGRGNRYPASSVRFENGALRFSWSPGPTVECVLAPDSDGGFAGPCTDGNAPGQVVMKPPKKG